MYTYSMIIHICIYIYMYIYIYMNINIYIYGFSLLVFPIDTLITNSHHLAGEYQIY